MKLELCFKKSNNYILNYTKNYNNHNLNNYYEADLCTIDDKDFGDKIYNIIGENINGDLCEFIRVYCSNGCGFCYNTLVIDTFYNSVKDNSVFILESAIQLNIYSPSNSLLNCEEMMINKILL